MLAKDEVLQGRYQIVRQLGYGGMGAVYEAKDERLGSSIALKEIIIELDRISSISQQDIFRHAFEREARLLANLHHEAFPRVTDYFSEKDRQFLIMELISGDDLGELINKNQKPFPLENILKWAEQLLDALDYLHTQNPSIFHRDIKPQNLKVTARGKIKLLDFGIAKSVDTAVSTMTNHTFVGATLNYSPIEQALPALPETFREFIILKHEGKAKNVLSQNTDARCDLYAVGATIYHLLTNRVPMDSAKRSLEIWEGHPDPLPNLSELNSEIPSAFSAWLQKAMEIERENRFSSANEMQESLKAIISKEKTKNITAEKTLVLPVEPSLPTQETKRQEQIPTQTKTERLITADEIKYDSKDKFIAETLPAPTAPSIKPVSDMQFPEIVPPPVTDSNFALSQQAEINEIQRKLKSSISNQSSPGILKWTAIGGSAFVLLLLVVAGLVYLPKIINPNIGNTANKPVNIALNTSTNVVSNKSANTSITQNDLTTLKNSIGMEFVKISAGSFQMGSNDDDKEKPIHTVNISQGFYMGRTEVTQAQWEAIRGINRSYFKGDNLPVANVSWEDVHDFIRKLNAKGEGTYRLPTEAEWEYACRAGSTTKYSYGDSESSLDSYAWYIDNAGGTTHEVATKQPNAWGLYDMYGNVSEWVEDWYGSYPSESITDPKGASTGSYRGIRGGSRSYTAKFLRSAHRGGDAPSTRDYDLGFRLLRTK